MIWSRFVEYWMFRGRALLNAFGTLLARHSPHGDRMVFNPSDLPGVPELEENWRIIRSELDEVLQQRTLIPNIQDISAIQSRITEGDQWKSFFLFGFGYQAEHNCAKCPRTTAALQRFPGMITAFFSILSSHSRIKPHRGPFKGILRYHLALIVPDEAACGIRVGDQVLRWKEGESLVFDDTFEHEAWNDSDFERVVLFVDVLRPLPWALDLMNRAFVWCVKMSPFVQSARRNFQGVGEKLP